MKFKIGTFELHPWEANMAVFEEVHQSPRGFNTFRNVRFVVSIEICAAGQSATISRLNTILGAFTPGLSCGLIDDSNNPVPGHWMPNSTDDPNNLSNVQIVAKRFPETKNGEFVSGRILEITLASLFFAPDASGIYDYKDSLTRFGNAGPMYDWEFDKDRGWYSRLVSPSTLQTIIHEGRAIGMSLYLLPPAPLYSPPYEQNHLRMVKFTGPDKFPSGTAKFITEWRYTYILPTFDDTSQPTIAI